MGPEHDHLASAEDRDLEREVTAEPRSGLGDFVIKYRRELAPLLAAGALTMVAAEGHQLAPRRWPVALLVGGVLTLAWHIRAARPVERLYGAGLGLLGSCLLAAGWALDVTHTWFWAILAAGALAGGVPWWRHQLPRGRLLGGRRAPRTMQEQAKAVVAAWPAIAEARGIAGVRLQRITPDEYGWTMQLRIPTASKHTVRSVVGAVDGLTASFRVRVGGVRVEPVRERADLCVVRVNVTDPLEKSIPYPGLSGPSIADPVRLGILEDRTELRVDLRKHSLLAGATGRGKTGLQTVIVAELAQREDVVLWGVDAAKAGLGFAPFVESMGRIAKSVPDAVAMLEAAIAAQKVRAAWMAESGADHDGWPASRERPQLVIVIDEVSDLLTNPAVAELLEAVTKVGREQGITVIAATQRASADAMGDSAVARAQFTNRLALGCNDPRDGDLVLGQGSGAQGWRPDRLQLPGALLVKSDAPEHQTPRPGRAYWLPRAQARKIAGEASAHVAVLEDEAAAAVAAVDQRPTPAPATRRGAKRTARERIIALLTDAGADGMAGPDIVAALDGEFSQPGVYKALGQLATEDLVVKAEDRAWRVTH